MTGVTIFSQPPRQCIPVSCVRFDCDVNKDQHLATTSYFHRSPPMPNLLPIQLAITSSLQRSPPMPNLFSTQNLVTTSFFHRLPPMPKLLPTPEYLLNSIQYDSLLSRLLSRTDSHSFSDSYEAMWRLGRMCSAGSGYSISPSRSEAVCSVDRGERTSCIQMDFRTELHGVASNSEVLGIQMSSIDAYQMGRMTVFHSSDCQREEDQMRIQNREIESKETRQKKRKNCDEVERNNKKRRIGADIGNASSGIENQRLKEKDQSPKRSKKKEEGEYGKEILIHQKVVNQIEEKLTMNTIGENNLKATQRKKSASVFRKYLRPEQNVVKSQSHALLEKNTSAVALELSDAARVSLDTSAVSWELSDAAWVSPMCEDEATRLSPSIEQDLVKPQSHALLENTSTNDRQLSDVAQASLKCEDDATLWTYDGFQKWNGESVENLKGMNGESVEVLKEMSVESVEVSKEINGRIC